MRHWHTCETTHCRAGWVVALAGEAGRKLERRTSALFAAMQIYKASGYEISPCRFFDSDADALEDMRRLADGQGDDNPCAVGLRPPADEASARLAEAGGGSGPRP